MEPTRPGLRTIPVRPIPADGESFAGYVLRFADGMDLSPLEAADYVGVADGPPQAPVPGLAGAVLDTDHVAAAAYTLRLTEDAVRAMLLNRWFGTLLPYDEQVIGSHLTRQRLVGEGLALADRTRACVACLAAGRPWSVWWRLPTRFVCPVDRVVLTDRCDRCRRPWHDSPPRYRRGWPLAIRVPHPWTACSAPVDGTPCGAPPEATAPLPADDRLVEAQARAAEADTAAETGDHDARDTLRSLALLWIASLTDDDIGSLPAEARPRVAGFNRGDAARNPHPLHLAASGRVELTALAYAWAAEALGDSDAEGVAGRAAGRAGSLPNSVVKGITREHPALTWLRGHRR